MTGTIRVTSSTDPRFTRTLRSWGRAEERARTVALLAGSATIERRDAAGTWQPVEQYQRTGSRVSRLEAGR